MLMNALICGYADGRLRTGGPHVHRQGLVEGLFWGHPTAPLRTCGKRCWRRLVPVVLPSALVAPMDTSAVLRV